MMHELGYGTPYVQHLRIDDRISSARNYDPVQLFVLSAFAQKLVTEVSRVKSRYNHRI